MKKGKKIIHEVWHGEFIAVTNVSGQTRHVPDDICWACDCPRAADEIAPDWLESIAYQSGIPAEAIASAVCVTAWGARYFNSHAGHGHTPWRLFDTKRAAKNWLRDHVR